MPLATISTMPDDRFWDELSGDRPEGGRRIVTPSIEKSIARFGRLRR